MMILTFVSVCLCLFQLLLTKHVIQILACALLYAQVYNRMYFFCHAKLCVCLKFFFLWNSNSYWFGSLHWTETSFKIVCCFFSPPLPHAMDMCMHRQNHKIHITDCETNSKAKISMASVVLKWSYAVYILFLCCDAKNFTAKNNNNNSFS